MNHHVSVDDQLKQIITPGGKSVYHVQLQRARITAIILALSAIMCLVFLVFAFVQKAAADQARDEAIKNEARATELEADLIKCRAEH
jgi:hypothetical protein